MLSLGVMVEANNNVILAKMGQIHCFSDSKHGFSIVPIHKYIMPPALSQNKKKYNIF